MKLQRIKCPPLVHAWDLTVSPSCIIGCTGKRAVILDRQYNLLKTVEGLDYVYTAHLSPDEKQLLLISTGNKFYVTDLASGTTRQVTVRAPFNHNLEGKGCWSHDGQHIYIPVVHSKTFNSTLRRYRAEDLSVNAEFLKDEYWITVLHPLKRDQAYFMLGRKRDMERNFFITMKDGSFQCIPLNQEDELFFRNAMQEEKQEIGLSSGKGYRRYALNGELKEVIENPFATGESVYGDMITKCTVSQCGKYLFMSTNAGFYLMDAATRQLLAFVPEKFGVQNFEQPEPDVIALATPGGVKLYRMTEK